ncbi:MAG: 5-oxoprolinase subunit PxpA [Anaerolineaceae bacterium]|nr:5-oxoprolinase subunit PxpA [Anaerolineaceae bacterium]
MALPLTIDLNCDLGESFGRYKLGDDAAMMPWITSANVACGFHAGDPQVMAETVALTGEHQVALGAHPGYPDLQGFGRRQMALSPEEVRGIILYQLGALFGFAQAAGVPLVHVKPHGALYNFAARDRVTAEAITGAVTAFDPDLILVGLAGSLLIEAGEQAGLQVANEGFPDRAYLPTGELMPRSQPGAMITDPEAVADNAVQLAKEGITVAGKQVRIDTLCLHGDNPQAVANAKRVRQRLEEAGFQICALSPLA